MSFFIVCPSVLYRDNVFRVQRKMHLSQWDFRRTMPVGKCYRTFFQVESTFSCNKKKQLYVVHHIYVLGILTFYSVQHTSSLYGRSIE